MFRDERVPAPEAGAAASLCQEVDTGRPDRGEAEVRRGLGPGHHHDQCHLGLTRYSSGSWHSSWHTGCQGLRMQIVVKCKVRFIFKTQVLCKLKVESFLSKPSRISESQHSVWFFPLASSWVTATVTLTTITLRSVVSCYGETEKTC